MVLADNATSQASPVSTWRTRTVPAADPPPLGGTRVRVVDIGQ